MSHVSDDMQIKKAALTMDMEQEEMQFLGFFGMVKESFKIIFTRPKIFIQITLALVLPLALIFVAHVQVSNFFYDQIHHDQHLLDQAPTNSSAQASLSELVTKEKIEYQLLMIAYFVILLALALSSTSAVVYTIVCTYTGKPVAFREVVSVVPKVWKRLMVTFLWSFLLVTVYNAIAFSVFYLIVTTVDRWIYLLLGLIIILIVYLAGFVYISVIWHLASVISVLEEEYGIRAMIKSTKLIKGKMGPAIGIFLFLALSYFMIQGAFRVFVVFPAGLPYPLQLGIAAACLVSLLMLFLFGLVIQTVIYFVCKSYHHQSIDKSSLANHLEVYLLAEYVPLKSKDVQLEHV